MELTSRGESLVEPVREALLRIQVMLGTQPTFDPKTARREFSVIMSEEAVPSVLPPLLRTLAAEAPQLDVHIEMVSPPPCHGWNTVKRTCACAWKACTCSTCAPIRTPCGRCRCAR
jgi:hypothetical protein